MYIITFIIIIYLYIIHTIVSEIMQNSGLKTINVRLNYEHHSAITVINYL